MRHSNTRPTGRSSRQPVRRRRSGSLENRATLRPKSSGFSEDPVTKDTRRAGQPFPGTLDQIKRFGALDLSGEGSDQLAVLKIRIDKTGPAQYEAAGIESEVDGKRCRIENQATRAGWSGTVAIIAEPLIPAFRKALNMNEPLMLENSRSQWPFLVPRDQLRRAGGENLVLRQWIGA